MKKIFEKNTNRILFPVLAIVGFLVLLFFSRERSFFLQTDSQLYIDGNMITGVMPVYPAFLRICRNIFGESIYLNVVVYIQTLLAVVASLDLLAYVKKHFNLELLSVIVCYIALLMLWGIDYVYAGISHQILTEGLTFPLFYIYFKYVLKSMWEEHFYRNTALHVVWALVMSQIRSQMKMLILISAMIFAYVIIRDCIRGRRNKKIVIWGFSGLAAMMLLAVVLVITKGGADQLYDALSFKALYIMDSESAELFDGEMRNIYEMTYNALDENRYLYTYAERGFFEWRSMLACSKTKGTMEAAWNEYSINNPGWAESVGITCLEAEGIIGRKMVQTNFHRFAYVTGVFFTHGLMCTVCYENDEHYLFCYMVMILAYLAFIVVSIILTKNKNTNRDVLELMIVTALIGIILNAMVAIVLFTIRRYVCYTLGLFYLSGWLCVREIFLSGSDTDRKSSAEE